MLSPSYLSPSNIVLLALAKQTGRKIYSLKFLGKKIDTGSLRIDAEHFGNTLKNKSYEACSISNLVKGQRFIDNETLSALERKASTIHVLTTTLEFDTGELCETVKGNLHQGKNYIYYIPTLKEGDVSFPELRYNLIRFKSIFENYNKFIVFKQVTGVFLPFFKEIVIHQTVDGLFAFTYLDELKQSQQLQVFEISEELSNHCLNWLCENSKTMDLWEDL